MSGLINPNKRPEDYDDHFFGGFALFGGFFIGPIIFIAAIVAVVYFLFHGF